MRLNINGSMRVQPFLKGMIARSWKAQYMIQDACKERAECQNQFQVSSGEECKHLPRIPRPNQHKQQFFTHTQWSPSTTSLPPPLLLPAHSHWSSEQSFPSLRTPTPRSTVVKQHGMSTTSSTSCSPSRVSVATTSTLPAATVFGPAANTAKTPRR
jgi:hypothetical protein